MAIEIVGEFEAHVQSLQGFERKKLYQQLVQERDGLVAREKLYKATTVDGSAYLTEGIRQMAVEADPFALCLSNSPEQLQEVEAKLALLDEYM